MIKKTIVTLMTVFLVSGCSTTRKGQQLDSSESPLEIEFEQQVGDRVFFDYNKSDLSTDSKDRLQKQAAWLINHPQVNAKIEGHCDERGTVEYNLALGERRAEAARKFLEHAGVSASRLTTISYGKERPAVIGAGETVWKQNRRDVTVIMKK